MKKISFYVVGILLFLTTVSYGKAPMTEVTGQKLANSIERKVQLPLYKNERVEFMCKQWPTCKEWVVEKANQNKIFQVIDTEVSHFITAWEDEQPIWMHRLYIQTNENGRSKSYVFSYREGSYSYEPPTLIKKFPTHPLQSQQMASSEYIKVDPTVCTTWPGCKELMQEKEGRLPIEVEMTQYVYKIDEQGNALWKIGLFVQVREDRFLCYSFSSIYFEAYQTKAGGLYTYKSPIEIKQMPQSPNFVLFENCSFGSPYISISEIKHMRQMGCR